MAKESVAVNAAQPPQKKHKIGIKRIGKRGGALIFLPDTMEELLAQGHLLNITAVKARRVDNEYQITDIAMIEPNDTVYLTDANDEAMFE